MDVTFFIGNGFDLNLGLKTRYKDFLNYYLSIETDNPRIKEFKKNIEKDQILWSDAEIMFGKYTDLIEDIDTYYECIRDFKLKLSAYLKEEQSRINLNYNKEETENILRKSITNYYEYLSLLDKKKVSNVLALNSAQGWKYNFVVFNYTNVFDNCLKLLKSSQKPFPKHNAGYEDKISEVVYIHGTVHKSMILGLDNESQILNKDFRLDRKFKECTLKPFVNKKLRGDLDGDVLRIIKSSRVICIFGMSIGETDRTWWQAISEWIQKDSTNYLVIINSDIELDPTLPEFIFERQDVLLNKFYNICNLTNEVKEKLDEQIFVVYNTDMFKLKTDVSE